MLAIYKKEMQGYFSSMIAYLFMASFIAIIGIYFTAYCVSSGYTDFAGVVLPSTSIWFAVLIPILTMRLWAEEKKSKTDQLLLTSPVSITKIVIGKYLAVLTLFFLTLCIVMIFPVILQFYGDVTWTTIFTGMLGYFLMGAALIAIGFFISSITENQIVAAVISVVVIVLFYLLGNLTSGFPGRARYSIILAAIGVVAIMVIFYYSTKTIVPSIISGLVGAGVIALTYCLKPTIFDNGLSKFVDWFSVIDRFYEFVQGILNVSAIVYFISFIGVFLLLTIRSIEKTRWN